MILSVYHMPSCDNICAKLQLCSGSFSGKASQRSSTPVAVACNQRRKIYASCGIHCLMTQRMFHRYLCVGLLNKGRSFQADLWRFQCSTSGHWRYKSRVPFGLSAIGCGQGTFLLAPLLLAACSSFLHPADYDASSAICYRATVASKY